MQAHNVHRDTNERSTVGSVGRPSLSSSKEQIEYLTDSNFSVTEISDILNVSKRTIERRISENNLTGISRFT